MNNNSTGGFIHVFRVFGTLIAAIVLPFAVIGAIGGSQKAFAISGVCTLLLLICNWYKLGGNQEDASDAAATSVKSEVLDEPPAKTEQPIAVTNAYTVKGTTFKNDDGSNRQTILRRIKFRDPPFDADLDVSLREYVFEETPAIGIYVNNQMVGNISKKDVPYFLDRWDKIMCVTAFEVTGGGIARETGERLNYGAVVYIRFLVD